MSSTSWAGYGPSVPAPAPGPSTQQQRSESGDRQKKPQTRQLLSCTKCRERKVKCDRTKPCSACCARGHPKECEFVVGDGNEYSPIQQSYEIRKLRKENQRLRERLQESRLSNSGEEEDEYESDRKPSKTASRAAATRQRRFKTGERVDNLYFGTPGLANIVADFANLQCGSQSLTHTVPRGRDMYASTDESPAYPFPIIWHGGTSAVDLAQSLLTSHDEIYACLDMFQRRAQSCYFPHTPDEVTKKEVERFLSDVEGNAEKFPDMLALIFATLATGMQMGVYDVHGGWVADLVEQTRKKSDVYLAASMQALRLASFMNSPTLLAIQTLIMIGPYLTNSGRFLDAWTLFGTTIRMAHSIGLHRDPKFLDPVPPQWESNTRRTLWWWMLHMDQQYSVTLGRPLGISGIGDCPPPEPLTTNPTILRLGQFIDHFTILARQILSTDGLMNVGKIDEFTDKLLGLWDTMPEALQFNESWLRDQTPLPDWPLEAMSATLFAKVQSFLVLLNRQRVERTQGVPGDHSPPSHMGPPPRPHQTMIMSMTYRHNEQPLHPAPLRGRSLVINSSISLLHAFLFFRRRNPAILISWTMGQQAFNACMILILDAWETEHEQNQWLVEQAFVVFQELQRNGVHKLAGLAVQRISDGIVMLGNRREQRDREASMYQQPTLARGYQPHLRIDTTTMADFSADAVMGNTGMFLLEDPGLQGYVVPPFEPLSWNMAGSAQASRRSNPTTPNIPSTIPVSQVTAAPYPVISTPIIPRGLYDNSYPGDAFAQASQHQNQNQQHAAHQQRLPAHLMTQQQAAFTAINTQNQRQQPSPQDQTSFSQLRGPRPSSSSNSSSHHPYRSHAISVRGARSSTSSKEGTGAGPRGISSHHHHHRPDRPPRSQQRRKW